MQPRAGTTIAALSAVLIVWASACGSSEREQEAADGNRTGEGGVTGEGGPSSSGPFLDAGGDGAPTKTCVPNAPDQEGCNCPTAGATRECYTGAPETRKKGVCHDGVQTCQGSSEFLSWTKCINDAVPHKESCQSQVDINCNGTIGCDDPQCATDPHCDTPCTPEGATRPCYEGPAGTENVGVCKDGQQTCISGKWTKTCSGQTLPSAEQGHCSDQKDNDCNGYVDCNDSAACLFDFHCITGCQAGTTRPCYDGPPGTEGVNGCHGGTQTCKPDGSGFDSCQGQVTPSAESCGDGVDNDCNGLVDCADPACITQVACCASSPTQADGTIYASSPTTLYRVNPSNYAVTTVGTFNTGTDYITDLALTPNGTLYGVSYHNLYTIDPNTGAATKVNVPLTAPHDGMTFTANNQLLCGASNGDLHRVDPSNGSVVKVGNYGNGLTTAGDLVAVADGKMYGTSATEPGGADATADNVLMQVDPNNGTAVPIGHTGHSNIWGIAFANKHVIGFDTSGEILEIDVATGNATVVAQKNIEFWGATQSPLVDLNPCP